MTYRSILACLGGGDNDSSMLAVASTLARAQGAKLSGLHVPAPLQVSSHARHHLGKDVALSFANRRREAIKQCEQLFLSATGEAPRRAWEVIEVETADQMEVAIYRRARCADLAVVSQVGAGEALSERPGTLPERLVMESGRPTVVVPPALSWPTVGQRILVAWNQSREAARALNDALPLLSQAEQVWVLTIDETGKQEAGFVEQSDNRAEQAVVYLAEHGITARPLHDTTGQITAGDILLSRVSDLTADLLVLGAYGHSRWRELVLGGVTRDLLSHMTVPVLMAH